VVLKRPDTERTLDFIRLVREQALGPIVIQRTS
jgi:hypothetical protein